MYRLLILLITISVSNPALVKWMPNKSFNLPINFDNHKLPCSTQNVVFPETITETVVIDQSISVSGLVLPVSGELVFENGGIEFGFDGRDNCTEDGYSYYIPQSTASWAQADVWSSSRFNEATPDTERLPCYNDEVEFPENSQSTIFMPSATQYVSRLKLTVWFDNTKDFEKFAKEEKTSYELITNDKLETGVVILDTRCKSPAGCPCQRYPLEIDCSPKFCRTPKCFSPIQPQGHCCKICGGYLLLDVDEKFHMAPLEETVKELLRSYGGNIDYHIGRMNNDKVQVILVDKGEYDGTSAEVINEIAYIISNQGYQSVAQISGGPISKAGLGGKIAVSMFFLVAFVMVALYIYYYRVPSLPEVRMPLGRHGRAVLGRFSRRTDSVVSLTSRRDSTATLRSAGGTAFRNPLYDSKRGRVQVAEPVVEENDD